jgi:P27 family predicted phage terminase small subunit
VTKGRKPIPAALRLLQGAPARKVKTLATGLIQPATPVGDPPAWFDPDQVAAWNEAVYSAPQGLLTGLDRATLITYCVAIAAHRAATIELRTTGRYVQNAAGSPMLAPAVRDQYAAHAAAMRAAVELGFTPSSRSRVAITPEAPEAAAPWAKFVTPDEPAAS